MRSIETILVTTDFSATSRHALPWARDLAERFGSKLILAHVHEDLSPFFPEYAQPGIAEAFEEHRRAADARLARLARELGPDIEPMTSTGTPHREIVRIAEERKVDLIVMATHGRGLVSHALLGSTTERVLRRAPCPVLVVRDPNAKRTAE
jgi:nucleotide-binding universal stress UspA family protein